MAKQNINYGAIVGDGTGDGLRDAFIKTDDNFNDLYNVAGWAYYKDGEITTPSQTFNTTYSKLQIDGAGSTSESGFLPREIRGTSEFWDTTNNNIVPVNVGDSYDIRLDFTIDAKTGSPTVLDLVLDIGGAAAPSINIVTRAISLSKTPPYSLSLGFGTFSLNTFVTNGGQFFLRTDTGTVDITARAIFIKRDYKGDPTI